MSKRTIVAAITLTPKNPDIFNAALIDVENTLREILAEYRNCKFVTDFTVEVTEQGDKWQKLIH